MEAHQEGMAVNREDMVNKGDIVASNQHMAVQVTVMPVVVAVAVALTAREEAPAGTAVVNTRRRHMMHQPLSFKLVVRSQGQRRGKPEWDQLQVILVLQEL